MVEIIVKKRSGGELSAAEIRFVIEGYCSGTIPDYQMAAWAMAVCWRGMSPEELVALTMATVDSGEQIDLSAIPGVQVDKHSTGGVGDTTSLVLLPLVAAVGVPVAKISGRGLGHTGGTIDKLESIAGFCADLDNPAFLRLVRETGLAFAGQTANLTPADKKLYALRDVTGTVESIPLIACSIMSKKIASGADAIVLDVKTGSGGFLKTLEQSRELAKTMVQIGKGAGRETVALITSMEQPLGLAVGNALEVVEAIDTLQGKGPEDLQELCLALGSQMVKLSGKAESLDGAEAMLSDAIASGRAFEKFREFIKNQGGDVCMVDDPSKLPQAQERVDVLAKSSGTVAAIAADAIGMAACMLGAGRFKKDDAIDPAVGIVLKKKVGQPVEQGEVLATLHASSDSVDEVVVRVREAYQLSAEPVAPQPLIYETITL